MSSDNELSGESGDTSRGRWLPRSRRRRTRRRSALRKAAAWTAACLVVALVAGALTAYAKYRDVWHSIKRIHVTDLGKRPPVYSTSSLNIVLIGSDSRSGNNAKFGAGVQGQRSDTIMILHISPGRQGATVLSIPRDSVVPVLECGPETGFTGQQAQPGQVEQINSSFASGGPGCLWKTVEQLTGIHLDHFIELNFTGFEKIINDIGGVSICLPWSISDPNSKLQLSKGLHHVMGAQALAFWRVRYIGEGSDLERIQRDQYLMASLVQGVERSGLITSPTEIYSVVTDAASAMTTDSGLSLGTMINILESLRGLSSQSVQFIQVPTVEYPPDSNWVQWAQPQADRLFAAIAHDRALPKAAAQKTTGRAPALAAVAASQVRVRILNGSGVAGMAGQAAAILASRGFNVTSTGAAADFSYARSVVEYSSAPELGAAQTLKAQLRDVIVRRNAALTPGTLELIIGSSFHSLTAQPAARASSPAAAPAGTPSAGLQPSAPSRSPVGDLTKSYGGITANANVCRDTAAFAGPDGRS
jgi:LCP family protein required for cell wall assembly